MQRSDFDFDVISGPAIPPPARPLAPLAPPAPRAPTAPPALDPAATRPESPSA
ncbi:hypothetical protein JMJ55_21800 [Belnapia sp. T6]|uniref:Uncharacterized protein n=1 Tax=Belnapia mucosa TaxID=2804532 RepID=A0ABS1VC58_9PROT|nr:hypothetical protein [Belnapia mucosa]MBL6457973.1 hypothetical protein [Belnapia mucosa]